MSQQRSQLQSRSRGEAPAPASHAKPPDRAGSAAGNLQGRDQDAIKFGHHNEHEADGHSPASLKPLLSSNPSANTQGSLLDAELDPNELDNIKLLAAEDLRASRLSREQIAERLSAATRRTVTIAQINVAVSHGEGYERRNFPSIWIPTWVRLFGPRILGALAPGYFIGTPEDAELAEATRLRVMAGQLVERAEGIEEKYRRKIA